MANKMLILQWTEDSTKKPTLIALNNVLTAPTTQDQTLGRPFSNEVLNYRLWRIHTDC